MNNPLISIIMNCYNGKQYLDQAIKSVINQTYKNWELIFWDNLSEDNSIKIFNKYKDSRLKLFSAAKHTLLYEARNLAFKKTKGDFIAFLDTDDFWLSDKLERQIPLFQDKDVGLVYGNYWSYKKDSLIKKKLISKKELPSGHITSQLLKNNKVGLVTIVLRKSFLNNTNNIFDVKYNLLADFKFVIDFSLKHKFDCVQEPVAVYRNHSKQMSIKFFSNQVKQMRDWFLSIGNENVLKTYQEIEDLENKIKYMEIVGLIYEGKILTSLKNILFYPFGVRKLKLILIWFLPNQILKYFRRYT